MKTKLKKVVIFILFFSIVTISEVVYIQKKDSVRCEQMDLNENLSVDYPASDIDDNVSECYNGTGSTFKFEYCQDVE